MRAAWIVGFGVLLILLAGCGKKQFSDPNVDDEYYIYLEDQQTHQIVSDQVLYTIYKNGTKLCGYAVVQSEDECYKMLEQQFYGELDAVRQQLTDEEAQAHAYEQQMNQSNGTSVGVEQTGTAQPSASSAPPAGTPAVSHGSSQGDSTQ